MSLIKQYQLIDKRILLIRNNKNYGTFRSRNFGILKSKGEYIILPDPDDILLQNSLIMLYNYAIKYNYEMLRFNLYIGKGEIFFLNFVKSTPSRAIYQPELKTFLFYASGKLLQIDFNVTNKFIKREALIRALNLLSKEYLNIYMINFEDGLLMKSDLKFYFEIIDMILRNEFVSINNKNFMIKLKGILIKIL